MLKAVLQTVDLELTTREAIRILDECTFKMKESIYGLENKKVVFIMGSTDSGKSVLIKSVSW